MVCIAVESVRYIEFPHYKIFLFSYMLVMAAAVTGRSGAMARVSPLTRTLLLLRRTLLYLFTLTISVMSLSNSFLLYNYNR